MKKYKSVIFFVFLIILVFAIAITINLWATENGIGIGPDSISYIAMANSFSEGNGLSIKSTQFPPFYPIILAMSGIFNSNVTDSARWLHALLYGVNTILFGVSIYQGTRRNLMAMILGCLIFLSSKAVLTVHSYAWSESPFLTFSLISYLLFSYYISSNKWIYLVFSSISLGLALATRYVGIALLPPVVISLFLFVKQPLKYKIKALFTTVILAITPLSLWVIRNLLVAHSATSRSIVYHPKSIRGMSRALMELFHSFILPDSGSKYFKAFELTIIILILIYIIFVLYKKRTVYDQSDCFSISTISLGLLFSIFYIVMVSFSIFFFDAATSFNERILLPVYLFLTISVICMVFLFSKTEKKQTVWLLFIVCVLFSVRINVFPMIDTANDMHVNGIGYNSRIWNESPTLSTLKILNPRNTIYSNGLDVIALKTGLKAASLPKLFSPTTLVENESYKEQLSSMCNKVMEGDAILVYLDEIGRDYLPKEENLLQKCPLPVLYDTEDGTIYGLAEK